MLGVYENRLCGHALYLVNLNVCGCHLLSYIISVDFSNNLRSFNFLLIYHTQSTLM